jgi:hypothetical protein
MANQEEKNVEACENLVKVIALGKPGTPIEPLPGWLALAPIEPAGGAWYFSFYCPRCHKLSPMFRDFSDGHLGKPFKGYGFHATCYFCKAAAKPISESVASTQWPVKPGGMPVPSEYAHTPSRMHAEDPEYRPVQGPLHHYTSITALLSIVDTKSLWATNVHYLNDSSESELGLALMSQVAEEARRTAAGIDAEFLAYFADWLNGRVFEIASVYVLCFSESHNQLSQWRGYTQHGRGVCLSIDSRLLVQRMQVQGWTFQHSRYDQRSQLAWAEAILARMRREVGVKTEGQKGDAKGAFEAVLQGKNLSDLLQVAATIKNEGFAEEHELRFISPMIDAGDNRVRYRPGRTALIPYIEFQLAEPADQLAIQEIMVGPSPTQHLTQSAIAGLVKQKRLREPCLISRSQIPYREL